MYLSSLLEPKRYVEKINIASFASILTIAETSKSQASKSHKIPRIGTMYAIYKCLVCADRMAFPLGVGFISGVSIFLDIRFVLMYDGDK